MKTRRSRTPASASSAPPLSGDAWFLALYEEQGPLTVIHPSAEEGRILRRSQRSTSNKYRTPLRKSANVRSRVEAGTELVDGSNVGSELKKRRRVSTGNGGERPPEKKVPVGVRRSPRLNGCLETESGSGSLNSMVLTSAKDRKDEFSNSKRGLIKLGRKVSDNSSVRNSSEIRKMCLRSRIVKVIVEVRKDECLNVKDDSIKSGEVSEDSSVKSGSELRRMCLRSRFVNIAVATEAGKATIKTENGESTPSNKGCNLKSAVILKQDSTDILGNETGFILIPESSTSLLNGRIVDSEFREKEKFEDSNLMNGKCLRSRVKLEEKMCGVAERTGDRFRSLSSPENGSKKIKEKANICCFVGEPFLAEVAQERWHWRYELKHKNKGRSLKLNAGEEDEIILNVDCHYAQARVGSCLLDIGDCVIVKGEGTKRHVGRILEFFKTDEGEDYFRVQWFFRAEDTVLKDAASTHDKRRLFFSTLMNDNLLDCILSKVKVVKMLPSANQKPKLNQSTAFYYDMEYCVEYSSFRGLYDETFVDRPSFLLDVERSSLLKKNLFGYDSVKSSKGELWLLDLYAGCGGMSTGLCIGAKLSGTNLVTKWAVDQDHSACDSLQLNHPETVVRNESAEDFLELLKQWKKLCNMYLHDADRKLTRKSEEYSKVEVTWKKLELDEEEYEVSQLVGICYGDPCENGRRRLHFKVHWKGYSSSEDTWEPLESLRNCEERIRDFVSRGFESKILPLPGEADVICGGPPCQGISGYNRFRNNESPFEDERNRQIIVFMDIVDFLKPKYVLMENVVDIIKFNSASLARYALSRLVGMRYQARLGTMASGCYGLPQFRLRVFIWGAHPSEKLPQFPLPTHEVVVRYWPPLEFERNIVAYDEGQPRKLEKAVVLQDSISDLPPVTNYENREKMAYKKPPETDFQAHIRLSKDEIMGTAKLSPIYDPSSEVLYDHRPLQLSEHDFLRVSLIPHRKGANFRDLPGIIVGQDNVARRDEKTGSLMLPTGNLLVPDCVLGYDEGKSKNPYARLWWDETLSTLLTLPNIRRQAFLHPEQDRILTIRECARLQGFPDFYLFCGSIKDRYRQIGNAVSVPVARALGYALGSAYNRAIGEEPLMVLPPKFSFQEPLANEIVKQDNMP